MDGHPSSACSIIYFCASAQDDVYELYQRGNPPETSSKAHDGDPSRDQVYHNVRSLLDDDVGGFDEVFVCSSPRLCLDRLESTANASPTLVLIELQNACPWGHISPSLFENSKTSAFPFLCDLGTDIEGAHFQKHVLPFALLPIEQSADCEIFVDGEVTARCLRAGAVDILRSPLHHEDINRIIGHIKDRVRPPAKMVAAQMSQNLVNSIYDFAEPHEADHRPDLHLSAKRQKSIQSAIRQWHFPAHDFNMDELTCAVLFMLEDIIRAPELEAYALPRTKLMSLILATRRQYKHEREVHYHNWRHAVDVTQSVYCFIRDVRLCPPAEQEGWRPKELNAVERLLTPRDGLILLVSAIGHDVGHPGVNNAFLVACNHPLAQTYNDKSVLENYHCAAYSQLLRRHWPALSNIAGFRATMISTILATDMQRHFEYMKSLNDLKAKTEASDAGVDDWSDNDRESTRELIMALLMKAADISNVARPFDISSAWAKLLMDEFARQGELESELQIPTCLFGGPPDNEDILAAAQSQKGFMSLFGYPLFQGISEVMPTLSSCVQELEHNRTVWDQKIEEEKERREPKGNEGHVTLSSVTDNKVEEATAHHRSDPSVVPTQGPQSPTTPTKRAPTTGVGTSPTNHTAHDLRQQLSQGVAMSDQHRSSMPFLGSAGPLLSSQGVSSRRSSKDVALDQLQQLSTFAHQSLSPTPNSRRGSADAGWQVHQSYPSSRRGSKDESLTTILVSSGGTPNRRSSPASPAKNSSPSKTPNKRQSGHKSTPSQNGAPSSRSHAASTATATTTQHSPSTQTSTHPSSVAQEDDDPHRMTRHASIPSTEDPFKLPGRWPNDVDGTARAPLTDGVPQHPPGTPPTPPPLNVPKQASSHVTPTTSVDTEASREPPRKSEPAIRESRSRSRLRSLKFWKKKKDSGNADTPTDSPTASP
ncbi:3',5'-cyclic-nucleotide phosphodiesterase [Vermiconidia calcicola]|uniref:3',5'-cyclic-nucleotide phosphodiesterase n=1 Tax=Vermiconidia calcicola TaxID=1690605 RepID=A0ACC3MLL8_9PEZI|nr:3',5'-cyclic-nucleotide phosphodiesterase [Vermiconidia calcicola]